MIETTDAVVIADTTAIRGDGFVVGNGAELEELHQATEIGVVDTYDFFT